MKVALICVLSIVVVLVVGRVFADDKSTCPDQLIQAKALAGNYQNDYNRKIQELSTLQFQLYVAQRKIAMLEAEAKKSEPKAETK